MAAKPDNRESDKKEAPSKGRKGLWIGIAATALALVGSGVGAGWYYTRPGNEQGSREAQEGQKRSETVFASLEPFTVNLADEGGDRLAQVAIVLELGSSGAQAALAKNLPIVRNNLLLLLSSQHTRTLLTMDGKLALAGEIALRTGTALGWKPEPVEVTEAADTTGATQAGAAQTRKPGAAPPVTAVTAVTAVNAVNSVKPVKPVKPVTTVRGEPQANPVIAVHFSQLLVQ